uniref:Uncharacterized protein n=1 Tax=Promethearchaeum syntrophicum TaxID=2594042 RepID=A0A5B9DEP3_9ARCH|nr:hypothetical protein DSAG12_03556 [Candidatus Prometheoarchaeum syntrophicum]
MEVEGGLDLESLNNTSITCRFPNQVGILLIILLPSS